MLPSSRAALAETRRGHREGVLRYVDVLAAERSVAEHESAYLDAWRGTDWRRSSSSA